MGEGWGADACMVMRSTSQLSTTKMTNCWVLVLVPVLVIQRMMVTMSIPNALPLPPNPPTHPNNTWQFWK